ncbi:hypothetical protein BJ912DRAFT_971006 [Pholiota molesta]|nr:hypothetical protein BJ912DRAFT_971006 [Pholiota molesta]
MYTSTLPLSSFRSRQFLFFYRFCRCSEFLLSTAAMLPPKLQSTAMSSPSCTVVHRTTADFAGQSPRTVTGHPPDSGTLPSVSHWQILDSSIPTSQSSPHDLPLPATRSRHVTQGRRAKVSRCSEASLSHSGRTALTTLDSTPPGQLSAPLLTERKKPAVPTTGSCEDCNPVAPFWESPSIQEDWPSDDSIEDASQCLVYRLVDDWLPGSTPPPPPPSLQRDALRSPTRMCEKNTVPEEAFSSNMAMMPLRKALRSAPHILPRSGVTPLSELFSFATLTQSIARLSGELAASAVAGYQNHYGDSLTWKRVGEKSSFGWKSEWEEDMRALEMDQWIPDGYAL